MGNQHAVLIVEFDNNDRLDDETRAWRAAHAADALKIVKAWFDYGPVGNDPTVPMLLPDNTYKVHCPANSLVGMVKERLLPHEGLVLVEETTEEGDGIHPMDYLDLIFNPRAE